MDISLGWKIVVGRRRFTSGHRTVGEDEEDLNNRRRTSDGLHEKQKHGRRYDRGYISLAFGSGWTALGGIGPNTT